MPRRYRRKRKTYRKSKRRYAKRRSKKLKDTIKRVVDSRAEKKIDTQTIAAGSITTFSQWHDLFSATLAQGDAVNEFIGDSIRATSLSVRGEIINTHPTSFNHARLIIGWWLDADTAPAIGEVLSINNTTDSWRSFYALTSRQFFKSIYDRTWTLGQADTTDNNSIHYMKTINLKFKFRGKKLTLNRGRTQFVPRLMLLIISQQTGALTKEFQTRFVYTDY